MTTISTYQLTPYLPLEETGLKLNSELFDTIVNNWMRDRKKELENEKVDTSLFYNHDPVTGKNKIGYPLIIFHYINGRFYLTGIKQGAHAVSTLASFYKIPIQEEGILFPGFKLVEESEIEIKTRREVTFRYRLEKWIPFNVKDYDDFKEKGYSQKISQLNQKLSKHIELELARDLNLEIEGFKVEITNIIFTFPEPIIYRNDPYFAYNIEFVSNLKLPRFLTLGNIKSLGFGRIEPL